MNEFEHQCVVKQGATGTPHVSETQTSSVLTTTTIAPHLPMPTRAAGNISNGRGLQTSVNTKIDRPLQLLCAIETNNYVVYVHQTRCIFCSSLHTKGQLLLLWHHQTVNV